ncbi:hypothetical protein CCICO_07605 [Corynebacterium ciconiae DSM 44920]|nr:hypothetical protein CCICO_07605 [Corynebacterium ciconiae DSM 44920]
MLIDAHPGSILLFAQLDPYVLDNRGCELRTPDPLMVRMIAASVLSAQGEVHGIARGELS